MTELIKAQLYQCVLMLCCGMATMLVKELINKIKFEAKLSGVKAILLEMAFYIMAAYLFSRFLYACSMGKIVLNCIAFYILGLWLWKKFFYDIISPGDDYGKEKKRQT